MDTVTDREASSNDPADYERFIAAKRIEAPERGFEPPLPISPTLFPFQRDIVRWACRRGCAANYCRAAEREAAVPTLFDLDAGLASAAGDA